MSQVTKMIPVFLPKVKIVTKVKMGRELTIEELCQLANVECKVTGPSVRRIVSIFDSDELIIEREPGELGKVGIGLKTLAEKAEIFALGVLAYAVFDYAARETMRGLPESQSVFPVGRPRKAHVLSGAERQRRYRARLQQGTSISRQIA